jgi:hypothetical protein
MPPPEIKFSTVIELMMEHTFGYHEPTTIRCGRDWYVWLRESLQAHAKSLGYVPMADESGHVLFNGAAIVRDDNLLVSELVVEPAYAANHAASMAREQRFVCRL